MLSEEEIIEEVKKELRLAKNIDDVATTIRNEYVEGLLDLYNKEKEKNKNLLLQLKDSEKELLEVTKNIISKDKIRELKKLVHKTLDDNGITRAFQLVIDDYFDSVLEEKNDR